MLNILVQTLMRYNLFTAHTNSLHKVARPRPGQFSGRGVGMYVRAPAKQSLVALQAFLRMSRKPPR
eukprot:5262603-Pleurochrysis_carterae.AAC.9